MYSVGAQLLGTFQFPSDYVSPPESLNDWIIEWYHSSGGLKRKYYIDTTSHEITSFRFNVNEKGPGSGTINFSILDFPIDADDYAYIYFNNTRVYQGIVDTEPDDKGGVVNLVPQRTRLKELIYDGSFTNKTIDEILQTVIEDVDDDSGVLWNAALVDTDDTTQYTITYNYETVENIIENLVSRLDDKYWGVNALGFLYVTEASSTVNKRLYYTENAPYTDIEVERDFSQVDATRFQVYKKDLNNDSLRIGQVGYASPYDPIELEKIVRKKVKKFTIPDVLADADGLSLAYSKLTAQFIPETIRINNFDFSAGYFPSIGDLIQVFDKQDRRLETIIDCDDTDDWTGTVAQDTSDYVEGSASLKMVTSTLNDYMQYNFDNTQYYNQPTRLQFMIKSTLPGSIYTLTLTGGSDIIDYSYGAGIYGDGAWGTGGDASDATESQTVQVITIYSSNVWQLVDIPWTSSFHTFRLEYTTDVGSVQVNIDRIQILKVFNKSYQDNVVEYDVEVTPDGVNGTVKLKTIDKLANDELFAAEKRVSELQGILEA